MFDSIFSRRQLLRGTMGLGALSLGGCMTPPQLSLPQAPRAPVVEDEDAALMYGPISDEPFPIRAVRLNLVDPRYRRQIVNNPTGEPAGTVVVDTPERFLYWTMPGGKAMRYGVGIGRDGFAWQGRAHIAYKRKWPTWTPPAEMIARQPELEVHRNGMAPGLDNPLGARALYIHQGNRDTLYRLHGNMDERSIGRAVSSGCVRLLYQDVIDLYERVPSGTPIVVLQ